MNQPQPQRLRATRREIETCLNDLDQAGGSTSTNQRLHTRRTFRIHTAEVTMIGPSNDQRLFLAATRNISRVGISVIVPQYVHLESKVNVRIPWPNSPGEVTYVNGTVVRCRYLSGTRCMHEAGIRFEAPINIRGLTASTEAQQITIITDNTELPSVLTEMMHPMSTQFRTVGSVDEIELTQKEALPLAYLIDFDTRELAPSVVVEKLRQHQPEVAIIALITPTQELTQARCYQLGCDAIMSRPLSRPEVDAAMKRISRPPTLDNATNRDEILRLIERFVAGMPRRMRELDAAIRENDISALEKLVTDTQNGASDAGFDVITRVANELEGSLHRGLAATETQEHITQLARLCLASAPDPQDDESSDADDASKGDDSK